MEVKLSMHGKERISDGCKVPLRTGVKCGYYDSEKKLYYYCPKCCGLWRNTMTEYYKCRHCDKKFRNVEDMLLCVYLHESKTLDDTNNLTNQNER